MTAAASLAGRGEELSHGFAASQTFSQTLVSRPRTVKIESREYETDPCLDLSIVMFMWPVLDLPSMTKKLIAIVGILEDARRFMTSSRLNTAGVFYGVVAMWSS